MVTEWCTFWNRGIQTRYLQIGIAWRRSISGIRGGKIVRMRPIDILYASRYLTVVGQSAMVAALCDNWVRWAYQVPCAALLTNRRVSSPSISSRILCPRSKGHHVLSFLVLFATWNHSKILVSWMTAAYITVWMTNTHLKKASCSFW